VKPVPLFDRLQLRNGQKKGENVLWLVPKCRSRSRLRVKVLEHISQQATLGVAGFLGFLNGVSLLRLRTLIKLLTGEISICFLFSEYADEVDVLVMGL
jgi:hypothetical protein